MSRRTWIALLTVAAFDGACSCGSEPLDVAHPIAKLPKNAIDFGVVDVGQSKSVDVEIDNASGVKLTVTPSLANGSSADFSLAPGVSGTSIVVDAEGKAIVNVVFSPSDIGSDTGALAFITDDPLHKSLAVTLTGGPAQPRIEFDPDPLSFADASPVQLVVQRTLVVKNVGSAPLHLQSIGVQSGGNPDFSVVPPNPLPLLVPGASTSVTVVYARSTSAADGHVEVLSDDPANGDALDELIAKPVGTCGDHVDNDGDGLIDYPDDPGCTDLEDDDESNPTDCLPGATQPCGTDVGECVSGVRTCLNGVFGGCEGGQGPVDETCNGKDDNCDGHTDEDLPGCPTSGEGEGEGVAGEGEGEGEGEGVAGEGEGEGASCPVCTAPDSCDVATGTCRCVVAPAAQLCSSRGVECGPVADGCCGVLSCGACASASDVCVAGHCVAAEPADCSAGGFCFDAISQPHASKNNATWVFGANDVWTAGEYGRVDHYDGTSWTKLLSLGEGTTVTGLWGLSSSDMFAATSSGLFHYNGATWTTVSTPAGAFAINGVSDNDYWIAKSGRLFHFASNTFTEKTSPVASENVVRLYEAPDGKAFAVTQGHILQFLDGATWTIGFTSPSSSFPLQGISGSASNNVWVVGDKISVHFDGSTWTQVALPSTNIDVQSVWVNPDGGRAFAVGAFGQTFLIESNLAPNPIGWSQSTYSTDVGVMEDIGGAASSTAGGAPSVFAVGWYGSVAHVSGNALEDFVAPVNLLVKKMYGASPDSIWAIAGHFNSNSDALLYYDGVGWGDVRNVCDTDATFNDLQGLSADNVWIVGAHAAQFDGTRWTTHGGAINAFANEEGIAPIDATRAIVVGSTGTSQPILEEWNGSAMVPIANGPSAQGYNAIWAADAQHVWIAGQDENMFLFDGNAFTAFTLPNSFSVTQIHGFGSSVFAVHVAGGVDHFDGNVWSSIGGPFTQIEGVFQDSANEAWFTGGTFVGLVEKWTGGTSFVDVDGGGAGGITGNTDGVIAFPNGDVWIAGTHSFARLKRP